MQDAERIEAFILRWQGQEGGQERANYALFLTELCDVLHVPRPEPANASTEGNDYVFERAVRQIDRQGGSSQRRIDLYKRDCFVLEAKQSRLSGDKQVTGLPGLFGEEAAPATRGRRGAGRSWDVLMMNARAQAEDYVRLLPDGHPPPPFVIVCDVGHCLELYANFRRDGKAYDQFPDRQGFRVYLEELRDAAVRERLVRVWTDPLSLDPSRVSARVTRDIAARLAAVSKALEAARYPAQEVAGFLMRALFTMFAEDVGLLPERAFARLLADCEEKPEIFGPLVEDLWRAMDEGGFSATIRAKIPRFNGTFFKIRRALPLGREEIGELRRAAEHDWRSVEPAIFGTLLEQALDPAERRRLGAHYTPRAYVERLVVATVIEPLREDWAKALATAERQKSSGRDADAARTLRGFHDRLCATRVLDPACGTGNFLYVTLELLKRLEGEVLEALSSLGGQEALSGLEGHTVDPHQLLGIEINPRAAAIAELVLWIGYLQWHFRTRGGQPSEPILRAFRNIQEADAILSWDGAPLKQVVDGRETCPNPRQPAWPEAEFIVGNPPFIGGKDIRQRMGDAYVEALWAAHPKMNQGADYVMYWWDRAASVLTAKGSRLRRFGLVTTNSISQLFQRRTIERHLAAKHPVSIVMAIPDHPWTKATRDAAAVRIAMTVAAAGRADGILREVASESGLDTDAPTIALAERRGTVNADLTIGVDVTVSTELIANKGISSPGVKLHGSGFIVTPTEAELLGLGRREGLERHIRHYRNGRDLTDQPRGVMVIDFDGLSRDDILARFPEAYQHLLRTVKPQRDNNNEAYRRENWWLFGRRNTEMRSGTADLPRYIATVETAKHRTFQFLDRAILPDNKLIAIGLDDAYHLGVLSSRIHVSWALRAGGWLGVGNDPVYVKSRCFDHFPFPDTTEACKATIRAEAEALDRHRKARQAEHPHLTLTGMYNVLERLRAGAGPDDLTPAERRIFDDGLVLILKEHHDRIDALVAEAYGWPADLSDEEILARLAALNAERAAEEARGLVRWLRPDYQVQRFGKPAETAVQIEADLGGPASPKGTRAKPIFPSDEIAQTATVMSALLDAGSPLDAAAIAARFRQPRRAEPQIAAVLAALFRMGVASSPDGGRHYTLRLVA